MPCRADLSATTLKGGSRAELRRMEHRGWVLPIRPTAALLVFLLLPAAMLLAGCLLWPFNWPEYVRLMTTPEEFRGDWVVNDYGATLGECDRGPGVWGQSKMATCITPGHSPCATCRLLPPGTPLKFLYRTPGPGEGLEDAWIRVGSDSNAMTVHALFSWEENLRAIMVRPGDRRPLPPVTAEVLSAGTVVEPKESWWSDDKHWIPERWIPREVLPGHNFIPDGNRVTARIMSGFGLRVAVKGPPSNVAVVLRTRVTHPRITDPQTSEIRTREEWDWTMWGRWPQYTGWLFWDSSDLVPGTWTIEVLHESGRVIAARQFEVTLGDN